MHSNPMAERAGGIPTFAQLLERQSPPPEYQLLPIFVQVLKDIEFHHGQAQLHLDIQPRKIVKSKSGAWELTDYGLTRLGNVRYMSPERAQRQPTDARSDIYSVGAVMFEAATGRPPFDGQYSYEVIEAHVKQRPPLPRSINPAVSAELQRVILTALAKTPAERYQTAAEFREVLLRLKEQLLAASAEAVGAGTDVEEKRQLVFARRAEEVAPQRGRSAWHSAKSPMSRPRPPADEGARPERPKARAKPVRAKSRPKRKRKLNPVAWIVPAVVVVAAVAAWYLLGMFATVPDVVGSAGDEARRTLEGAGLVWVSGGEVDDTLAAGEVVKQSEPAGKRVRRNDSVVVHISTGMVAVPNLAGSGLEQARAVLAKLALPMSAVDTAYSDEHKPGLVMGTKPRPTSRVKPGTAVTVVVSAGRATCPECGTARDRSASFCVTCGFRFEI